MKVKELIIVLGLAVAALGGTSVAAAVAPSHTNYAPADTIPVESVEGDQPDIGARQASGSKGNAECHKRCMSNNEACRESCGNNSRIYIECYDQCEKKYRRCIDRC
jgi:hypothetical protein